MTILIVLSLLIIMLQIVKNAGTYLLVSETVPSKLDVIFTFAGERARNNYSLDLMAMHPETHWLLSDYKNGYVRILRRDSFDMSRVTIVDTCRNTLSEVRALKTYYTTNEATLFANHEKPIHIGLISGPYHMRRIKLMVDKVFHDQNVVIHYLPVPLDKYNWTNAMFKSWWNSPVYDVVTSELIKIAYFYIFT